MFLTTTSHSLSLPTLLFTLLLLLSPTHSLPHGSSHSRSNSHRSLSSRILSRQSQSQSITHTQYSCASNSSFWGGSDQVGWVEMDCALGTVCLFCGVGSGSPCVFPSSTCESLGYPSVSNTSTDPTLTSAAPATFTMKKISTGSVGSTGSNGSISVGNDSSSVVVDKGSVSSSVIAVAAPSTTTATTSLESSTVVTPTAVEIAKQVKTTTTLPLTTSTASSSTSSSSIILSTASFTTNPISLPTSNSNSGSLTYPPTPCSPSPSPSYASDPNHQYTTTLPIWSSSSYIPISTPSPLYPDGTPSPGSVDLPGGMTCEIIESMEKNGGQRRSCVKASEGGQMASTYTPSPGSNCPQINYDPYNSLVAAYPYPINNAGPTPFCGQEVEITAGGTGNKVTVVIVDSCSSCWGVQDVVTTSGSITVNGASIDLGPAAYRALFGLDAACDPGVWDVSFTPLSGGYSPQAVQNLVSPM